MKIATRRLLKISPIMVVHDNNKSLFLGPELPMSWALFRVPQQWLCMIISASWGLVCEYFASDQILVHAKMQKKKANCGSGIYENLANSLFLGPELPMS